MSTDRQRRIRGGSRNFVNGDRAEDNVSAQFSFIANAHA